LSHFRRYAPEKISYALDRFGNEMDRLMGVMAGYLLWVARLCS